MPATFEERYEAATLTLTRRFRWARRTLLSLTPVERPSGTLAVDEWHRLYFNRAAVDRWTDAEFVGAVWHEVNHLLRRHPDRFAFIDVTNVRERRRANIAADCEINAEIGCTLPPDVYYPESVGLSREGGYAERYYAELRDEAEQKREERRKQREQDENDDRSNEENDTDESNDDEGNDDDNGDDEYDDGDDSDDDGSDEDSDDAGDTGDDGSDSDDAGDDGTDDDGGSEAGDSSDGDDDGDDADTGNDGDGDSDSDGDGDATGDGEESDDEDDDDYADPGCGSASGGTADGELDEPDDETREEIEREERKQARDIMDEYDRSGYSTFGGGAAGIVEAAKRTLEVSAHDWRKTFATVVRTAMMQATDEAEDFTFKRMSRRQASFDDIRVPGSFRPVPELTVVVDESGSMDAGKVAAACREVRGILERLAIPTFRATLCDTDVTYEANIRSKADIAAMLDYATFGGTDMMRGIEEAMAHGAEVVVVLTDCECQWDDMPPRNGVPVIVAYIGSDTARESSRYVQTVRGLSWATFVAIESDTKGTRT